MRCGKEETESLTRGKDNRLKLLDDEYAIVHCTGYIKVGLLKIKQTNCVYYVYKQVLKLTGFPWSGSNISKYVQWEKTNFTSKKLQIISKEYRF